MNGDGNVQGMGRKKRIMSCEVRRWLIAPLSKGVHKGIMSKEGAT